MVGIGEANVNYYKLCVLEYHNAKIKYNCFDYKGCMLSCYESVRYFTKDLYTLLYDDIEEYFMEVSDPIEIGYKVCKRTKDVDLQLVTYVVNIYNSKDVSKVELLRCIEIVGCFTELLKNRYEIADTFYKDKIIKKVGLIE